VVGVDLAGKSRIAAPHPVRDCLAERRDAPDRRIAAELAQMQFKRRAEEGRKKRAGLAERKVDRRRSGLDALKQLGQTRERRGDEVVEMGKPSMRRHAAGVT